MIRFMSSTCTGAEVRSPLTGWTALPHPRSKSSLIAAIRAISFCAETDSLPSSLTAAGRYF